MNRFAAVCLLVLLPSGAFSQTVSDAALAECQALETSFAAVKDCLPPTEAAHQLLGAVVSPDFYGDAGKAIVAGCEAANKKSPEQWVCVRGALKDAVDLVKMVGTPDKIQDKRFVGVTDDATLQRLLTKQKEVETAMGLSDYGFDWPMMYFQMK
jgi:hypothetical protein